MTPLRAGRPRRRALAPLGLLASTALLTPACSPSPVPTSGDVPRSPLAALDPADWDARTAEELLALPLDGAAEELETWAGIGAREGDVAASREAIVDFVAAAYLSPEELRGLDDAATLDRLTARTPEAWLDPLRTAWEDGGRPFYSIALAEPFRTVGLPALSASWHRAEQDGAPVLALAATIAWAVIDTGTRAVGVIAHRLGLIAELDDSGGLVDGHLRVTMHGLDGCGIEENEGLLVPALADEDAHRSVQEATRQDVLGAPRIPLAEVLEEDSALFAGDDRTYLTCS
ncbi:hypothetical protein [Brachybacterium sp. EE-P12]|uniref:hypothetical protein n=1 Tax=Brachybacterium sp. EE-P12 TaxID=2306299 RepID=UPI000F08B692|nr:hypothetical protein [Brachybacterium sp. EE-P12]